MNYDDFLENSFIKNNLYSGHSLSRLEYLANNIFDIDTYESECDELFARKALQVCYAITNRKTFEYIENKDNRIWYLIMCNMPFFKDRVTFGTSIRGAFWDSGITLNSCGLWDGDEQITDTLKFDDQEWVSFINAVIRFAEK